MSKARYAIKQVSEGQFALYEDGFQLITFARHTFRYDLESLGRGNGWIGAILRLFSQTYPFSSRPSEELTPLTLLIRTIGDQGIAEYLRHKGYPVYKPVPVSDTELINYIQSVGYTVGMRNEVLSPLISTVEENNNGRESRHSGAEPLCLVGGM